MILKKIATMLNKKSYVRQSIGCIKAGLQPAVTSQTTRIAFAFRNCFANAPKFHTFKKEFHKVKYLPQDAQKYRTRIPEFNSTPW